MSERLTGRSALVFGGGGGVSGVSNGQAAAMTYAREGAAVAVADLDSAAARHTVDAIRAEGGTAQAFTADVTCGDQLADTVRRVTEVFGGIDVLHNNVGVTVLGTPADLSYEQWQRAFRLNVDGVFLACKHVLPAMVEPGRGAIVNVSSIAGMRHVGYPYPAYMSAKAAVNQLTVSLALTYAAHGIRVNAVAPGFIDTPLVRRQLSNSSTESACEAAAYVNGVCLPVDGGLSMSCG